MSFNIVDAVKDQVKGQLIGHMGSLLGDEGVKATGAVDNIIPALLNGVSGSASTQNGADSLFGAIQNQDDSLLDNLGSMLGGGQASTVIENGNGVLSSLFGSGGLSKLAGALSGFTGVSRGGTSSLMGILAPIVLGVLKRKVMGDGMNASSLSGFLSDQRGNIGNVIPQGLNDQLSSSGFLSGIGGGGLGGIASGVTGTVGDGISGITGGVAAGAAGVAAAGAAGLASATGAAGSAMDSAGNAAGNVGDRMAGAAGSVGDGVSNMAGNARDGVANAAGSVGDGVSNMAGNARDGVANAAGSVGDGVSNMAGNARDGVANAAGSVGDGVSNVTGSARDGVAGAAGSVSSGVSNTAGSARDGVSGVAGSVADAPKKGGSMFRWLLPILALGALAWAAFTYLLPGAKDVATDAGTQIEGATDAASGAADAATDAASGAADAASDAASDAAGSLDDAVADADLDPSAVSGQITGLFGSATETLGGITDAASAEAALPALEELGGNVDSVTGIFDKIPEAARGPLSSAASAGMGTLQPIVDKVTAIPGVGDVVGPVLEPILEKLGGMGG